MKKRIDDIKPFIVLTAICLVISALLAVTNHLTKPLIDENKQQEAQARRSEVLPEADEFNALEVDPAWGIDEAYACGDAGYVIRATRKGYGTVSVTVGLNRDGEVVGISIDASGETSGIGSKVNDEEYRVRYIGVKDSADGVDLIANATYSSSAVKQCVNAALAAYEQIGGGAK